MYEINLTHSIDAAHRVVGHEGGRGKCARLHGHTYSFDITCRRSVLDETGFVVDFARLKAVLNEWDHRTILWDGADELADAIERAEAGSARGSVVRVPFNPTSENMARHLSERLNDVCLDGLGIVTVTVRETPKSSSSWTSMPAPGGREPW